MTMKKILICSNYDYDMFQETWLGTPCMQEDKAIEICNLLNQVYPNGPQYYRPVDPTYAIQIVEP